MTEPAAGDKQRSAPANGAVRVLVVEDTPSAAELIRRSLEADGLRVELEESLAGARARLGRDDIDVVVLDIELPDGSGLDLLRDPGGVPDDVPVVILSAHQDERDRVVGLELGADDYVAKPFFPRELAARVRLAARRRAPVRRQTRLEFGELVIDLHAREVITLGQRVRLTDLEFDLLVHLAEAPRQVFHRDDLLRAVWRSSPEWQSAKTVTEHVRRVRQKIDAPDAPSWITTVGRSGYRFEPR